MSEQQSPLSSFQEIKDCIAEVVVGQEALIDRLLLALVCNGHVLLEGVPGVAKTLTVSSLATIYPCAIQPDSVHARPTPRRLNRNTCLRSKGPHFHP